MRHLPAALAGLACAAVLAAPASAQVLGPDFGDYTILDLGAIEGVPAPYGGLAFKQGDPNTLLLTGFANNLAAKLYEVSVSRDAEGHIIGVGCGGVVHVANVPGTTGGVDGGLDYGPDGVLFYTTYSDNRLGQIRPGSAAPDKLVHLSPLGIVSSTGTLRFVPPGFPGAGRLKIASYNGGGWYDCSYAPDGNGTYDVEVVAGPIFVGGGPEGIVYIAAGNPGFSAHSVLVSRYSVGAITAYEVDANGDPISATARDFMTGLSGAEGAAIDPITGDFLFSTFGGGSRVIRVSGFTDNTCTADLNLDGRVDGADLGLLVSVWGKVGGGFGDLNTDCIVNGEDLGVLLGFWGDCD